jgi:DNA-directed RNA polymerase subunit RPC12/RpoP
MFIVYVQCHTCGRKEWATKAELDWVNAETGKPIGRRYRARHGEGEHRCPECQEKAMIAQAAEAAAAGELAIEE